MKSAKFCQTVLLLVFLSAIPCTAQGPWSTPVNLGPPVNDTLADFQPAISPDGLSLYVVKFCNDAPACDSNKAVMWVFHRPTRNDLWGSPEMLPSTINVSGKTKATPFISADGHGMYFASNRTPGNCGATNCRNDLWVSYRDDVNVDSGPNGWQAPLNLGPGVNSGAQEQMGCVFTNESSGVTTLIFNSDRRVIAGVGNQDLYTAMLLPDGTFGSVVAIAELNTDNTEQHPICSRDGLEMFFISDRPGGVPCPGGDLCGSPGGTPTTLDIWVSTRASTADPWGPAENLDFANAALGGAGINAPCHDGRPALSLDGTELYFYSAECRPGSIAPFFDIWSATRPDTTPPSSPAAHVNPAPNAAGWNNTDTTVSFTSNGDPGHISTGVAECTQDVLLSSDTSGFQVNGTCTDRSGNVSAPASLTVRVDKTPPVVQITGVSDGGTYLVGAAPAPGCSSGDSLSGSATSATLTVTGGNSYGVGTFIATCNGASDVAGNIARSLTATYIVTYAFTGFLPPLNSGGEYKLGSTIPVKWQLRDANGNNINRLNAVQSLQLSYDGFCSAESGAAVDLGGSGNTGLRYDASGNQFIFNWQTKGLPAGCYSVLLSLDDSTVHSAMVSLK